MPFEEEIRIKRLSVIDIKSAEQLFMLLQKVFEVKNSTKVSPIYLKTLLNNTTFICFAAFCRNKVVGGLTAYVLPKYDKECSEIFIYDIAVKPELQRTGIGKKLILAIKEYSKVNKIKEMFVDANQIDKYAIEFYRSVNGREEEVIQFTFDV